MFGVRRNINDFIDYFSTMWSRHSSDAHISEAADVQTVSDSSY